MLNTLKADQNTLTMGIIYGLMAALLWGAWPVVSSLGLKGNTLTPYDITALRFAVSGIVLLPLILRKGVKGIGWPGALLFAFGAGAPYMLLTVTGLNFAPASHMGIVAPSCMMTISTIGSWFILGDRPSKNRLFGLGIVILGVAILGWKGLSSSGENQWMGHLLFVAGGGCWACYTVGTKYFKADPLHATALVAVLSMVLYLPLYFLFGDPQVFTAPLEEILFQGIFQGFGSAILALLFYTKAVALLGASRGAVFAALVPGIAVILALPVLGEVPTIAEIIGVCVVTLGMVAALGLIKLKPS
ncbi:DMT family transporter [Kiloniella antarctica]|uniref:DMT family transporter n=1 Tax=Kiloniella antarctica TaxID=1550907 RepID=A0ABW5BGT6_9PROT